MIRFKIIVCIALVFFLSGCTAEYNLVINDNNSITESVDFIESIDVINTYSESVNEYLNEVYNLARKETKYNSYDISTYVKENNAIGNAKKNYKNFDNFKKNSIIVTEMFKNISKINNDNIVEISLLPTIEFKYFEESGMYSSVLDKVEFRITLPYNVISGNYDKVVDNTYIWNINKNDNLKEINIKYKEEFISLNKVKPGLYVLGAIVGIILIFIIVTYLKNRRNNKY